MPSDTSTFDWEQVENNRPVSSPRTARKHLDGLWAVVAVVGAMLGAVLGGGLGVLLIPFNLFGVTGHEADISGLSAIDGLILPPLVFGLAGGVVGMVAALAVWFLRRLRRSALPG